MSTTYSCYYCTYKATTTQIVPHYMNCHKEQLYKDNKENCNAAYKRGTPITFLLRDRTRVFACLGCSKFYIKHQKQKNHFETCPNKQSHKDKAFSLIPIETKKDASTQTEPSA